MEALVSSTAAQLFIYLLALLFGVSSVLSQDLKETDAMCNADGCFVVNFQRKTFLESWRACKEKGGNLATIKRKDDAAAIASLFSTVDLRHSRTKVRVWIGLQRQPRQCSTTRPLRGFSWTTGDQDTAYTNWQREDSPGMCSSPRCVVMGYSTHEQSNNFKWLDGSCSVTVDGYLCHYAYKGMCAPLWDEGAGSALYSTPFNLLSTLLTHVPTGSIATMPCPSDTKEEQSVLCMLKEDGSAGWSRDYPLCQVPPVSHWCDQDNGGCEHFCRPAGVRFYCECADGYQLAENGQNCEQSDVCQGDPCEFECLPLLDGYRCACPEGYMLAPDERGCLDVDECLQSPCEQLCVNSPGTFECQCREGYQTDDEGVCEDIDECINDPCEHACENTVGSHICHCHLGFSPMPEDTSRCQDTDECQIPGTCEQMCVNYEGGFECYCEEGYELMSDHYSCRKRGEEYDQSAVTPPFPWPTHQPRLMWDPEDYDWNPQSHTDWPPEQEHSLDWLTDPPKDSVIWVTSPQKEDFPFDIAMDAPTQKPENDGQDTDNKENDLLEQRQNSQTEPEVLTSTMYTTPPPMLKSITTLNWYEYEHEETTTVLPFLSTSTILEGAWNWWVELTTSSQKLGNPEDSVVDQKTDSSYHREEEEYSVTEKYPGDMYFLDSTHSQDKAAPTQVTSPHPSLNEDGGSSEVVDIVQDDRQQKQSRTWLLVALLVPICIFIVVMVVLGIVFCNRCGVQPRSKNATDCYHWISGAHDKHAAPNPSSGIMTHV